jgi:phosphoglucosamine mutase
VAVVAQALGLACGDALTPLMTSGVPHPIGEPLGEAFGGFGTDGVRGLVGAQVTPALALQLGYWCGQVLKADGPVVIGMDSRRSGPMLTAALTAGLTAAGRQVWNLGLCPTPAVPLSVRRTGAAGGLMVSASHNPPHDNGIKVFGASGAKLPKVQQQAIEAGLRGDPIARDHGFEPFGTMHERPGLLLDYQNSLWQSVAGRRLEGCKIVLDLCWGSATACGEAVFRELGAEVLVLHGTPDGSRINVGCGSTHLEPLSQAVQASGAAMGFAFDGDADRMLAVDSRGRVFDGDQILYLWGSALLEAGELSDQRLVATVMSNLGFERAWQAKGGVLERTAVGDQYVHQAMEELGSGAVISDTAGRREAVHMRCTAPFLVLRFGGNDLHPSDSERIKTWVNRISDWHQGGLRELYFLIHQPDSVNTPETALLFGFALNARMGVVVKTPQLLTSRELF